VQRAKDIRIAPTEAPVKIFEAAQVRSLSVVEDCKVMATTAVSHISNKEYLRPNQDEIL
jgi:hypothetical protein